MRRYSLVRGGESIEYMLQAEISAEAEEVPSDLHAFDAAQGRFDRIWAANPVAPHMGDLRPRAQRDRKLRPTSESFCFGKGCNFDYESLGVH